MRRYSPLIAIALTLSACGSLLPTPGDPPKKYLLSALSHDGDKGDYPSPARPHQLVVDLPTLYPPLDSSRIALKRFIYNDSSQGVKVP